MAAEAITEVRDKLTDAVIVAGRGVNAGPVHVNAPVRKLFADYLAAARAAWSPDVQITPAWVRRVTTCSRGLSPRLAKALRDEIEGGHHER